jgi:hypothetical protein
MQSATIANEIIFIEANMSQSPVRVRVAMPKGIFHQRPSAHHPSKHNPIALRCE